MTGLIFDFASQVTSDGFNRNLTEDFGDYCCKELGIKNMPIREEMIYGEIDEMNKNNDCIYFTRKVKPKSFLNRLFS